MDGWMPCDLFFDRDPLEALIDGDHGCAPQGGRRHPWPCCPEHADPAAFPQHVSRHGSEGGRLTLELASHLVGW